jgi:GAF domain-containing protein
MSLKHGFCPEVVARGTALVLPDVFAAPRFAGNAVVDLIGIRTYAGAPLIHSTGVVLGTVCFVGPQEQPTSTGQASLTLIKQQRDEVMNYLYQRIGKQLPQ